MSADRIGKSQSHYHAPRRLSEGRGELTGVDPTPDLLASERALGNLLTVIKAEAQLLERSVCRSGRHQPEQTGERLAAIIAMVDQAAVELYRLSRLRELASRK
ncbi:MAG: hypothetical protein M3121_05520 [Chloroflexota bacterium]|nr:hypothetical protein [Chloroflexota bacterium]